ncbi:hypothetical protein [Ochrobactrum chromiisoli]|uniref:Uncharacterized protein n=1 Tax=Ochrobactrum chromiisoli TaxID=2993941 RepID=A0ABT3QN82_9HYPH|nr:hypothetical protein [Ochrobactrum chromiisoli]MCX2697056.1 hypothetical protein [Ochrobactrum chromiisoli]
MIRLIANGVFGALSFALAFMGYAAWEIVINQTSELTATFFVYMMMIMIGFVISATCALLFGKKVR